MPQIHRFRDRAAVTVGGPTLYLDAKAARVAARALLDVARSIERESFAKSSCGSVTFPAVTHAEIADTFNFAPADCVRTKLIRAGHWAGYYRRLSGLPWKRVRNGAGRPIDYASEDAAREGAAHIWRQL